MTSLSYNTPHTDSNGSTPLDMVMPLDAPQPVFSFPPLNEIEETPDEKIVSGLPLRTLGASGLPPLVFGGASLSPQYNEDDHITSLAPVRTIRTALRYGITAFDTSAYYGPSEIILGSVLNTLRPEFPRSSYMLMTKCGRFGSERQNFDYSPEAVRKSVERSLLRLKTNYIDVVYLHDIEFVAEEIMPIRSGNHNAALSTHASAYGLAKGQEGKIWGEGDQRILDAYSELRKMQAEGLIRKIGITGYPLPTLLRIALLILHNPPYKPVDILLSYSHSNMQNSAFAEFAPHLRERAQIGQLLAASPLNMGLLTPKSPAWHPAPPALKSAVDRAIKLAESWPGGLPNIALGYAMRKGSLFTDKDIPTVVGLSTPAEVHEAVRVWRESQEEKDTARRLDLEHAVLEIINSSGFRDWSWASPTEKA